MEMIAAELLTTQVRITWEDQSNTDLPYIWLRDNDPADLHPDTQERTFDLTTVSFEVKPTSCSVENQNLLLTWPDKTSTSSYSAHWLQNHQPGRKREDPAGVSPEPWHAKILETLPRFDAKECAASPATLCAALQEAKRSGIVLFDNLDDSLEAGEQFAQQIGFKRQTNFGVTFEVINAPNPNNLAYTSVALPLHTDLPNQELIPGYQFLHCWRNEANGGESRFADGLQITEDLRTEHPAHFQLLSQTPLPWRFHDQLSDVRYRRPVINLNPDGSLRKFAFNAHIADIPDIPATELPAFYQAYQTLMLQIREPRYLFKYALAAGEMVMFDNHRVLHGRDQFDPSSGTRHFRGFYIEHNEVDSCIRILGR